MPSLERQPHLSSVLRGTNPEFRPLVRRALAVAAATPQAFRELSHAAMSCVPLMPIDLRPSALAADGAARPGETIARLTEYVDRSGVLPLFVAAAAKALPEAGLLNRIKGPVDSWDKAHNRLLKAVAAGLRSTNTWQPRSA